MDTILSAHSDPDPIPEAHTHRPSHGSPPGVENEEKSNLFGSFSPFHGLLFHILPRLLVHLHLVVSEDRTRDGEVV